jgi:SHS2 domain-containing protein
MNAGFEILDHTADIGVRAWGRTPEEMFEYAVRALFHLMYDPATIAPRAIRELEIRADGYEYLLVDLFNEILYIFDAEKLAFRDVTIHELSPQHVRVRLTGEPFDLARHEGRIYVKAATLHQLRVEREDGMWVGEVYLDI